MWYETTARSSGRSARGRSPGSPRWPRARPPRRSARPPAPARRAAIRLLGDSAPQDPGGPAPTLAACSSDMSSRPIAVEATIWAGPTPIRRRARDDVGPAGALEEDHRLQQVGIDAVAVGRGLDLVAVGGRALRRLDHAAGADLVDHVREAEGRRARLNSSSRVRFQDRGSESGRDASIASPVTLATCTSSGSRSPGRAPAPPPRSPPPRRRATARRRRRERPSPCHAPNRPPSLILGGCV